MKAHPYIQHPDVDRCIICGRMYDEDNHPAEPKEPPQ